MHGNQDQISKRMGFILFTCLLTLCQVSTLATGKNSTLNDSSLMPNDEGFAEDDITSGGCIDWQGKLVADGEKYVPNGNDMCLKCTCDKQFPVMCTTVACSNLNCANPKKVKGICCEHICMDDGNSTDYNNDGKKEDGESITNLSLRLIASTVTSFLVLALLLFMVHRLRQRRLLLAMRRFEARARQVHDDTDSEPYIPDAFMSLECPPYTDPPPPYSPPKPPQIMPGEQPPPYDEINQNGDANGNSANENRNEQISSADPPNNSGGGPPAAGAAQETGPSPRVFSEVALGSGQDSVVCGSQMQGSTCQPGHQRSSSENTRPSHVLPAYASTDVVEGLGVVISPGSDAVSYTPYENGWNTWRESDAPNIRQSDGAQTLNSRNPTSSRERPRSLGHSRSCRVQELPTTTAFQRFSNIFKRDSWRVKNRRRNGRPASEYHASRHYATVPRHEQTIGQDVRNSQIRCEGCGRDRRSRHPDSMCQESRGGHSHCQRCGCDRISTRPRLPDRMCLSYDGTQYNSGAISPSTSSSNSSCSTEPFHQHYSTTTTTTTSSNGNSISPQGMNLAMYDDTMVNSYHRQQFQNELRRHLPPLQTSDQNEPVNQNASSSNDNEAVNPSMTRSQPPFNGSSTLPSQISRNPLSDTSLHQARQPANFDITNVHSRGNGTLSANTRPSVPASNTNISHTSMPLYSHEPQSNLTSQQSNSQTQQSLASFIRSNPSATITDIRQHISERKIIPPHPSAEMNPPADVSSHQTLPKYSSRSSHPPNASRTMTNEGLASGVTIPDSDGGGFVPSALAFSSSSSPSPSPPVTALAGTMRRSHSGVSQASMFSVCSETGEKKLKAGEVEEDVSKVLSSDSQYPEYHNLSVSRSLPLKRDSRAHQANHNKTFSRANVENPKIRSSQFSEMCPPRSTDYECEIYSVASNVDLPSTAFAATINCSPQHYTAQDTGNNVNNPGDALKGCEENQHNFNSVPVDKTVTKKSLPSVCEENKITQAVNIPPLLPNPDPQLTKALVPASSKPVQSAVPSSGEANNLGRTNKAPEVVKKSKKKRTKERSSSSPQALNANKSRHSTNSPKNHRFNLGPRGKDKNFPPKSEEVCNEKEVRTKSSRVSEKKLRNQCGAGRPPVRFLDNSSKAMTRPVGDAPLPLYGNADVYRGLGGDSLPSAVFPPLPMTCPPYSDLWHKDHHDNVETNTGIRVVMNDLNQPPNHLKGQHSENHTTGQSHGATLASGKQDDNPQTRKKSHRRQTSAGDKAGHVPSPQRHKFRPKSFAAPNDQLPEKHGDGQFPHPSIVSGDFNRIGKGAKSGFGHDLNFDDQTGLADFHIHDMDFTHKRLSLGHDAPQSNSPFYGKVSSRTDGQMETVNNPSRVGTQTGSNHPGSKSGLSNELSFVSRGTANSGRKKRQSLPALTTTFVPPSGLERKISCGAGPWQKESESQNTKSQIQGERSLCHQDGIGIDFSEPASYV